MRSAPSARARWPQRRHRDVRQCSRAPAARLSCESPDGDRGIDHLGFVAEDFEVGSVRHETAVLEGVEVLTEASPCVPEVGNRIPKNTNGGFLGLGPGGPKLRR